LVHTGQRRGDVLRMGRQHVRDGIISIKQQKTGVEVDIPVHPELAAAIAACPSEHLTFLTTDRGAPVNERHFNRWFCAAVKAAGLPASCVRRSWSPGRDRERKCQTPASGLTLGRFLPMNSKGELPGLDSERFRSAPRTCGRFRGNLNVR
jgi:integrase